MRLKIAIYTAMYAGKDKLRAPLEMSDDNIDYFYFSDIEPDYDISPYQFIKRPILYDDLAKNARRLKILGDPLLESYDMVIWHDANMQMIEKGIKSLINRVKSHSLSIYTHPDRDDPYSEAMTCIRVKKESAILMLRQCWHYFLRGLPAHSGLYSTGLLVKVNLSNHKNFYNAWWQEVFKYSRRDQLALAYTSFKHNFTINTIDGDIYNNPYLNYYDHNYLEYRTKNNKMKLESGWVRKLCFLGVKVLRKLSKLKR
ncbi:glycosyltransferase domain-containing protein [Winogradskyella sp. A3E31]|uniref:glycosyltransferase domain-containing protein n=1 Tax=Winogradskyella sp. A3E31 TaxID=3349637 RepID=UPI00398B31DD